ncbi:MAG TPA: RNA 2',3'-cyclic phosphodiesterase [Candidatus Limnocylindria bacterium]|nr:RNA 2',3'-cyclic phosphodiesterase [Candidatus Limnocylindria bacterium]
MPGSSSWRLFVAAPMPAAAAHEASAAMAALRARHPDARWLPPHKLHLTLVFLGPTESRDVQRIAAVTAVVAERHRAYEVVTGNGGGRVNSERGGVCWLRLEEGGRETSQLALDLDRDIGSATYDATHPPHPHLTLARGIDRATLDDVRSTARGLRLSWVADRLVIFRSYTDPGGSVYEELAEFPLPGVGAAVD